MALTTNIVAYYKMEGNSNDAVAANNGTDTSITYSSGNGKILQGAGFPGNPGKITLPSGVFAFPQGTNAFTINLWATPSTSGGDIVSFTNGGAGFMNEVVRILLASGAGGLIGQRANGSSFTQIFGGSTLTAGTYYMATLVYDGTNISIYLNAVSDATPVASAFSVNTITGAVFGLEINTSTNYVTGHLDEVGFWSRALSGAEITQLYNGGIGLTYPFTTAGNSGFFFAVGR